MTVIERQKIAASDEQIEGAFEAAGIMTTAADLLYMPASEMDAVRAARKNWAEAGTVTVDTADTLIIEGAQSAKGQPRRDITMIKLGDFCAIND